MIFPFGKFKGKQLEEVPTSYITWCLGSIVLPDELQKELENQLKLRAGEGVPRDSSYIEKHGSKI